jgi:threonine synthase
MFEHFLVKSNSAGIERHINVIGATSGDTGGYVERVN